VLRVDRQNRTFEELPAPSLSQAQILERADLQECIYNSSDAFFSEIGEQVFVIAKEVTPSETVQDRIDLLAVDAEGVVVIVELKRGSNKLQMLQAISYAGMLSRWGPEDFRALLSDDKWAELSDFLNVDVEEINRGQRLLLVAEGYDYALLSGAEWLSERYGVDIRCAGVALATDPATQTEYLACSSIFPPPALAEQAASRGRGRSRSRPIKWANWDDAIAALENSDLRTFAEEELNSGRESYLRRRGFHYRLEGRRRWSLYCRNRAAYVWQRGRFHDDEIFWKDRVSDHDSVTPVKRGLALSFNLHSKADLEAFRTAVNDTLKTVVWHKADQGLESHEEV